MAESERGAAAYTASASELLSQYALLLIAFTILYYDYFLTLPTEIASFWPPKHKLTWASSFFFANRYLSLLVHVPVIFETFIGGDVEFKALVCEPLLSFHQYYAVAMQVLVGILCMMRIYALYNRSWRVLGFLIAISIGSVVVACWAILTGPDEQTIMVDIGVPGCNPLISQDQGKRLAYAWSGVLVFDTAVFGFTIWKTLVMMRSGSAAGRGGRLLVVLLRDGAMYFSILFAANLSNILLLLFASPLLKGVNVTLTNVLSAALISRLMLNIRSAYSLSTRRRQRQPHQAGPKDEQLNPRGAQDRNHIHTHTHTHTHHHPGDRPDDDHAGRYEPVWSEGSGSSGSGAGWSSGETETSGIYLDTVIPFPSAGTGTTWSLGAGGAALAGVGVDAGGKIESDEKALDEEKGVKRDNDRDWMGWMDVSGGGGGREDDVEMFAESPAVGCSSPDRVQGVDEHGVEMVPLREPTGR